MGKRTIQPWQKPLTLKETTGASKRKANKAKEHEVIKLRKLSAKFFIPNTTPVIPELAASCSPQFEEENQTNSNNANLIEDMVEYQSDEESALSPINEDSSLLPINEESALLPSNVKSVLTNEEFALLPTNEEFALLPTNEEFALLPTNKESLVLPTNEKSISNLPSNAVLNTESSFDQYDPSTWTNVVTDSIRTHLILAGPKTGNLKKYPDTSHGVFSDKIYTGFTKNGEAFHRDWLIYSVSSNSLFCFPCCLFSDAEHGSPWSNCGKEKLGFQDFRNQKRSVIKHEESHSHLEANSRWKLFLFNHGKGIMEAGYVQIKEEENHWRCVLRGILDAILFLAQNNLSFRGSSNIIGENGCGNFLNLVGLLEKYYPPLNEHVNNLKHRKTNYLSPLIQNEFISICGDHIRTKILNKIRERKYYSILFDSTPDTSHMEQVSQVIRTVECSASGCYIEESFIDFITGDEKKGSEIAELIKTKLNSNQLNISDCRGQGYDNASNMSGIYKGVQKWIKDINPLAEYIPCAAHSLNLVGVNSASRVLPAKLILGQIQNLYSFFARSTKRWTVIREKLKCNLQAQSNTRWSARSDAVSALSDQFPDVVECLIYIINSDTFNAETIADANSRLRDIYNFRFYLGVTIWRHILYRIQVCNCTLQQTDIDIADAEKHLSGLLTWLQEFRLTGFKKCYDKIRERASEIGVEEDSGFQKIRVTRMKKRTHLEKKADDEIVTNLQRFEREFFNVLMDNLIKDMLNRFTQIKSCNDSFSFMWGERIFSLEDKLLEKHSMDLSLKYSDDINGSQFTLEVTSLKSSIQNFLDPDMDKKKFGPLKLLNLLHTTGLVSSFRNVEIALRIFLTLPVTVASNERSFSKLKIIKNYLRSSMGQEQLTNLAILSIEYDLAKLINFDDIIDAFASSKVRRINLSKRLK